MWNPQRYHCFLLRFWTLILKVCYALLKARMAAKSIFSTARKSWIWWALTLSHESLFMAHTCPTHDRMKVTFSWYCKCFISQFFDRVAKRWQSVVTDFNFLDKLKKICMVWKSSSMKKYHHDVIYSFKDTFKIHECFRHLHFHSLTFTMNQ